MDVEIAGSGPAEAVSNTGDEAKSGGIDDAMNRAFASVEQTDVPDQIVKDKLDKVKAAADAETTAADGKPKPAGTTDAAPTAPEAPKHWDDARKEAFSRTTRPGRS